METTTNATRAGHFLLASVRQEQANRARLAAAWAEIDRPVPFVPTQAEDEPIPYLLVG